MKKLKPIEKAWDWHSRAVPEDGYDIETDLKWVIGEDVMLKKDFKQAVKAILKDLYREIKHGDKEHQKWLKNKINQFIRQ